jgi:ribosome assembly protein 4
MNGINRFHLQCRQIHIKTMFMLSFSPGRTIASCSFDRSVKLWQGSTGKYINSLRSHVEAVYQIAWSGDSRLCASASRDSTIKVGPYFSNFD